jgi:hypothetical protein
MSIQATIAAAITIIDTDAGFGVGADNTRTYDAYNKLEVLNAGSTPPVSKYSCAQVAMSGGTGSVDLRALADRNGGTSIDGNGLKVQSVLFYNPATNANSITVSEGGTNGHPLCGASFTFTLQPGQGHLIFNYGVSVGTTIATADKTWDLAGTGSQALDVVVAMG